jgi:L-lactate dehydrogenase complex protein LldF
MSEIKDFKIRAAEKSRDDTHRLKILKAISTYEVKVDEMKSDQFVDWNVAQNKATEIKKYVVDKLPELLQEFEKKITANGAKVLWAKDKDEAQKYIYDIVNQFEAKKIVKSKSMTTEEIDFNEFCESKGLEVIESDLGELIVQLAGEKPYHIVTPAMHKSKKEISELFAEKLGSAESDSAAELTMFAREHLRTTYTSADIGVTGANFLIADSGAVVLTENEGNIRLSTSCPPVHIAIAGIEKVLPRLSDLSLFLPLLATSGTGQQITGYNSIFRGPKKKNEIDGPQHMFVILLDNGRSNLYSDPDFRETLQCIRCGACLNTCPVYRTIGGHSYNTTYQGPIGSVITPHLKNFESWNHLSSASSLCGACTQVCPVSIDLHHLLLLNRVKSEVTFGWNFAIKFWSKIMLKRSFLNFVAKMGSLFQNIITKILPSGIKKRIPKMANKSFSELWKNYE